MPADVPVWLKCPGCQLVWFAALIRPGNWWEPKATPAKIAWRCYCPRCEHVPPMELLAKEPVP
jgi:hypothetical protein